MTENEQLARGVDRDGPECEVCSSPATPIDGRDLCIDCWLAVPEAKQTI